MDGAQQPDGDGTTLSYGEAHHGIRTEAANVLIWYSHDYGQLRTTLQSLGHHVTTSASLPDDLSAYDVIWHVGAFRPTSASERERLLAFLAADGGLHLTGERPCCVSLNQSWTQLVNAAVAGGGITVGQQGDVFGQTGMFIDSYPLSRDAKEDITSMPRPVESLRLVVAGGIAGLASAANVLARGRGEGGVEIPVGALWNSDDLVGHSGRLSIIMDANWFSILDQADNTAMVENLQIFLQGARSNQCPIAQAGADHERTCLPPGEEAAITLDGTETVDGDGDGLTYTWLDDSGREIASGPMPTVTLPSGEHDIALVVSDGTCTSAPDVVHLSLHGDEEPPLLSLRGEDPAVVQCGQAYIDPGVAAEDVCSGDLTARVVTTSNVDTSVAGAYTVVYEVTDDAGYTARRSRTVLVEDSEPPAIEVMPPKKIWPPNHAYHTFTLADCVAAVRDTCDATLDVNRAGWILGVYSNQAQDTTGDGHTYDDIVVLDDATFQVRAERQGHGKDRVYEVDFAVADASGNTALATCALVVPHNG